MKKNLILILILLYNSVQSQVLPCKCTLLDKFEDSVQNSNKEIESFVGISKSQKKRTLKPSDFIKIKTVKKPSLKNEIIDSLKLKLQVLSAKIPSYSTHRLYKIEDSLTKVEFAKKIYGIPKPLIVKVEEKQNTIGILYMTTSFIKSKYYLYLSKDKGKTWKNYFTGFYKNQPYLFKSNSKYPLWKDENHIQIEADILTMTKGLSFPGGGPDYETSKNNTLAIINLKEILKDSDDDGWNDLDEEMEYFTNPYSKDTDGDGTIDSEDLNPKYITLNNDFTKIFQAIIYGHYQFDSNSKTAPFEESYEINIETLKEDIMTQREKYAIQYPTPKKNFTDDLDPHIIVTDDDNLRRIDTFGQKVLFLSSKEFREYQKINPFNRHSQAYSKIYKCDNLENTYILKYNGVWHGNSYLITKTSKGYKIKMINYWTT